MTVKSCTTGPISITITAEPNKKKSNTCYNSLDSTNSFTQLLKVQLHNLSI